MNKLATRIVTELGEALRTFGTYSFDDKGASEVMGISELVTELKKLPVQEVAVVLFEVANSKKHKGRGLQVAMHIVLDLQDWDELFEIPGIDSLLEGELPQG